MTDQTPDDLILEELKRPIAFLEKLLSDKALLAKYASTADGRAWLQGQLATARKWGAATAKFSRTCDKMSAAIEKTLRRRTH